MMKLCLASDVTEKRALKIFVTSIFKTLTYNNKFLVVIPIVAKTMEELLAQVDDSNVLWPCCDQYSTFDDLLK